MLLYRLINEKRQSANGFQWPKAGTGEIVRAPDWDPDPTIDCGKGLHGVQIGEYLQWPLCQNGKGYLQIIETIEEPVRSGDNHKWRFPQAIVVAEFKINSKQAQYIMRNNNNWYWYWKYRCILHRRSIKRFLAVLRNTNILQCIKWHWKYGYRLLHRPVIRFLNVLRDIKRQSKISRSKIHKSDYRV